MNKKIFLVGPMGSGKSTIGRLLAKRLELPHYDLDAIIEKVGPEGTILIPCFNWDFCKGKKFNYLETPPQIGSLPKIAFKREDFKRTKHPIYSFLVWENAAVKAIPIPIPIPKSSVAAPIPMPIANTTKNLNFFLLLLSQY